MVKKSTIIKSLALAGAAVCMMAFGASAESVTVSYNVNQGEILATGGTEYTIDTYKVEALNSIKFGDFTFDFASGRAGANYSVAYIPADSPYIRLRPNSNKLIPSAITVKVSAPENLKMTKISFTASNTPNYGIIGDDASPNPVVMNGVNNFYWEAEGEGVNELTLILTGNVNNAYTVFNLSKIDITYDEISTGIETVYVESASTIYTLTGVKLNTTSASSLPSGLYIINGKKTAIR